VQAKKNCMLWLNPVQASAETCGQDTSTPCRLAYTVNDGTATSQPGYVTFYDEKDPSGTSSDFSTGVDGWTVTGNTASVGAPNWEPTTRGALSYYVHAKDDVIAGQSQAMQMQREGVVLPCDATYGCSDTQQWYFAAPTRFLNFQGHNYGGSLSFQLMSSSGNFAAGNLNDGGKQDLVVLDCASCARNKGVRLVARMNNLGVGALDHQSFDGRAKTFTIPLTETHWLKDPKSTLAAWTVPSQCEFMQVLSHLTGLRILGDHTKWHESVSLDSPRFIASCTKAVPLFCACDAANDEEVALGCGGTGKLRQDVVMKI
jgi:hypothetical protein